ncbi:DUF397 domain-containing protein [Solihabitans fulvus]|uniref:DUF397 domain-containing protein n=1 Tax=Solihabitans fulvus TaxID=1892852 RepID=A0A5B2XWY0_9PSEU|nr:DUF397 domain-containing protein [Solihabitans fulvus]KAA2267194.1 DUF397 domain-containing protein [Solihabitans fulvus]
MQQCILRNGFSVMFPGSWLSSGQCGPDGGNCVQLNLGFPGVVGIRDSKPSAGPVLVFPRDGWAAFLAAARIGRFDCRVGRVSVSR